MQKNVKKNPYNLKKKIRKEALNPGKAPRTRREILDYGETPEGRQWLKDLKLNHPDEYNYLLQFTDEWAGASIEKTSSGRVKRGHLHKTYDLAKDCMDRNNRRNNDVLGVTRANNLAFDIQAELSKQDGWYITNVKLQEDALIHEIESELNEDDMMSFKEFIKVRENMIPEIREEYEAIYAGLLDELEQEE